MRVLVPFNDFLNNIFSFIPYRMWSRCEETDGKIMFSDFLQMLKVDVSPGDLVGTSTHIQVLSDLTEQQRMADIDSR